VRLDGPPLALERAAARVSLLSLSEILEHLDQRLTLLTSGALGWLGQQDRRGLVQLTGHLRSHRTEGRHRSATAVAVAVGRNANLARVLTGLGTLAAWQGDLDQARPPLAEAINLG
jgi:hypothetical protein